MGPPRRYPVEQGYTAKEAMSTSAFWFLQGEGLSEEDRLPIAAAFIGILSLSALVFYPIVGLPSDRISKTKSSTVCMVSGALSMVAL